MFGWIFFAFRSLLVFRTFLLFFMIVRQAYTFKSLGYIYLMLILLFPDTFSGNVGLAISQAMDLCGKVQFGIIFNYFFISITSPFRYLSLYLITNCRHAPNYRHHATNDTC